jgi:hypothetical protein
VQSQRSGVALLNVSNFIRETVPRSIRIPLEFVLTSFYLDDRMKGIHIDGKSFSMSPSLSNRVVKCYYVYPFEFPAESFCGHKLMMR